MSQEKKNPSEKNKETIFRTNYGTFTTDSPYNGRVFKKNTQMDKESKALTSANEDEAKPGMVDRAVETVLSLIHSNYDSIKK